MKWTSHQWTWKQCEIIESKVNEKKNEHEIVMRCMPAGRPIAAKSRKENQPNQMRPPWCKTAFPTDIQVAGPGRPQLLCMMQRWVTATKATKCCCNFISNSAKARAWCRGHGPLRWRQPTKFSRLHSNIKNVQRENHLPRTWTLTFSNDFYSKIKE